MLNRFMTLKNIALLLILGLCAWIWFQSQHIRHLKAENHVQAQTLKTQSAVISELELQAKESQRITLELSQQESDSRRKSNEIIQAIPKTIKESDPFNARAPDSVVGFLRQ